MACHKRLTPKYREYIKLSRETKQVYHLKSAKSMAQFLIEIENQNLLLIIYKFYYFIIN